jgi:hypothetical protein
MVNGDSISIIETIFGTVSPTGIIEIMNILNVLGLFVITAFVVEL